MAKTDTQKAKGDILWQSTSTFGQESISTTWRLARMKLALRSIEGNLGLEPADSFHSYLPLADCGLPDKLGCCKNLDHREGKHRHGSLNL